MDDLFDFDPGDAVPVAELFHENSKLPPRVSNPYGSPFGTEHGTPGASGVQTKAYRTGAVTDLPSLAPLSRDLSDLLRQRRSVRRYREEPVELWQVGQLLGWSHGLMRAPADASPPRRPAPSAGGLYPMEIFVAAQSVVGLKRGVHHYDVETHSLKQVAAGCALEEIHRATLYPEIVTRASLYVMMAAAFGRTCHKYGERGYRFVMLDCGHLAQNLHLVGAAVGLGSVGIGGFLDDQLNDVLDLDGVNEAVVHTMALGVE